MYNMRTLKATKLKISDPYLQKLWKEYMWIDLLELNGKKLTPW